MKLRKLARQLAAAAVAGAMTLSLCMPALAETWNISNDSHGFSKVYSVCVAASSGGRTVELFGVDASNDGSSSEYTETDETVLSGSGATFIRLRGYGAPVAVTLEGLDTKPEVSSTSDVCIRIDGDVSVELRGENTLTIPDRRCIAAEKGSLTLGGTGTLNIRGGHGISVCDIYGSGSGSFTMNGGSVDMAAAEGSTGAMESGITADTITLNDGSIHVLLAPSVHYGYYTLYNDALSASKDIFIRGGSVVTETVENTDPFITTFRHRALYSRDGDIVISGGSVQAKGGELFAGGSIRISGGEVKADALCSNKGLTISGGKVTTKGFNVPDPIVLSGDAKVTFDGVLGEGGLSRFDLSGLTTDGYLCYKPVEGSAIPDGASLDSSGNVIIHGTLEPQPGGDAGNASGDAGGAIAAVVLGSAAVWGGYEVVTRVILNELLPEGAAIPANRGQLALLVWNNAGRPEPAAQPTFADVADADMAKAAQWCAEQGIMEAKSADTFKPEGWTPKFNVIETWNKAFPKH